MVNCENCRAKLVTFALLALTLLCAQGSALAQALPFNTGAGQSSTDSVVSPDSSDAKGNRTGRAAKGAPDSAGSPAATQGYVPSEDARPSNISTLHVQPDNSAEIGKPFAHVLRVAGDIAASTPESNEVRHLRPGDSVSVGDHLQSSGGGELLLQASDASMIALRPASELWIESYAAEGKPSDHMVLRLVDGGARMVAGFIPHVNPAGSQVETPTTTIGAGDSDHETFVVNAELASSDREQQGTYDRVNRGSTVMRAANQDLEIEVGHVGFVGASSLSGARAHTVLLPVSLDKLPAFYARGSFDQEMDNYVKNLDQTSDAMLQRQLGNVTLSAAVCDPARVGKAWLQKLDSAVARRDAARVAALFTADARFTTSVRGNSGTASSSDVDRRDFMQDMVSIPSAGNASQQRVSSSFSASAEVHHGGCAETIVQSMLVRRGTQAGKPYRSEALETYHLDLIGDAWLAVSAMSVPQ
jgi:hypothetical protein